MMTLAYQLKISDFVSLLDLVMIFVSLAEV